MAWTVKYTSVKQVDRAVQKLRSSTQIAFYQMVEDFKREGPTPVGWRVKQLKGEYQGKMSLRLDYRHRVIYEVFSRVLTIVVIQVTTRKDAY